MRPSQDFSEPSQIGILIETQRAVVIPQVQEILMANPFWEKRYGERGRKFILQDLHFNIDFLTAAVRLSSPASLSDYYRWQQEMLVARGLCTRHLRETQEETHSRLMELLPDHSEFLQPFFDASEAGLTYAQPDCLLLDKLELQIAEAVTGRIYSDPQPDNFLKRQRCTRDTRYYLSYLLDAVALDQPERFAEMMTWIADFLINLGIPASGFYASLGWLSVEIETRLPQQAHTFTSLLSQLPGLRQVDSGHSE